jgi:hypothetical protein
MCAAEVVAERILVIVALAIGGAVVAEGSADDLVSGKSSRVLLSSVEDSDGNARSGWA